MNGSLNGAVDGGAEAVRRAGKVLRSLSNMDPLPELRRLAAQLLEAGILEAPV